MTRNISFRFELERQLDFLVRALLDGLERALGKKARAGATQRRRAPRRTRTDR
jgi:hypothetical protein